MRLRGRSSVTAPPRPAKSRPSGRILVEKRRSGIQTSYSAVRELTRIATAKTEEQWLRACKGQNLRQIEEQVAERVYGDLPTDAPKPERRPRRVSLNMRPAAQAALRSARQAVEAVRGERVDDSELIEELCVAYLAGGSDEAPRAQIAITVCESCEQAWQHAAGRKIAITEAEYETAACDAKRIGSLDGDDVQRAESAIPPATRRKVMQRDGYRCTVPGCRASRFLHVHHIVPRALGGSHKPSNLTTLCGGHHGAHHRGELTISGKAPKIVVTRKFEVPHVGESQTPRNSNVPVDTPGDAQGPHVGEPERPSGSQVPHVGESVAQCVPRADDPGIHEDRGAHRGSRLRGRRS